MYDRAISKQGMSNRVVDEENPETILQADQVMSLVAGLDTINEPEIREFDPEVIEKYDDEVVQTICYKFNHFLTKEPFKHESLLLHDRKTALSRRDKITAKKQYQDEKNAKSFGAGRNNWINGPPTTSYFPGVDYKSPDQVQPFRPLSMRHPKWPEVQAKLYARGFKPLKRSQMPIQLRLQDRQTGEPTYIRTGEEVDFYRNLDQETILVTGDCKVVEVKGGLLASLNVDNLARSNVTHTNHGIIHPRPTLLPHPGLVQVQSGSVQLNPGSVLANANYIQQSNNVSLLPTSTSSCTVQQFPRRIDPGTSLGRFFQGSKEKRSISSNPSTTFASMLNPNAASDSRLPNILQSSNGGASGTHYRSILPDIQRSQSVSRIQSMFKLGLSKYFLKQM